MLHLHTQPVLKILSRACCFLNHFFSGFIREERMSSGMGADSYSCGLHLFKHFPTQRGQPIVTAVYESETRLEHLNHAMDLLLGHIIEQRSHD